MQKKIALIIAAALLSAFTASFMTALPLPFSALQLPLILIIALVAAFRFDDAIIAAFISGLISAALSTQNFAAELLVIFVCTRLAMVLFARVFTNLSAGALAVLHAVAFLLFHSLKSLAVILFETLSGFNIAPLASPTRLAWLLLALLLQLAIAGAAMTASKSVKKKLAPFFFFH